MNETILRKELAGKGFEFLQTVGTNPDGSMEVEANKLHTVSVIKNDTVYAAIPVTLTVKEAAKGRITITSDGTPSGDEVEATEGFVKTLLDNNQLAGLPGNSPKNATHQIVPNENGQKVIRRQRVFGG